MNMVEGIRPFLYGIFFLVGWYFGMAQDEGHKWFVGSIAAYGAGAFIRMLWM